LYTAELLTRSVDRIKSVHNCWLSKAILKSKPDRFVAKTFQSILQRSWTNISYYFTFKKRYVNTGIQTRKMFL